MQDIYSSSKGFVITYKDLSEPYLFNELNEELPNVKLLERGKQCAAFSIEDYTLLLSQIREYRFVFAQHIHPFLFNSEIRPICDYADLAEIIFPFLDKDCTYTCQCRIATKNELSYSNSDLTIWLSDYLSSTGFQINSAGAEISVSLTLLGQSAYIGISRLEDNISKWNGGVLFYNAQNTICRSELKLEEAFEAFHLSTNYGLSALDLGAAPGGWTHFLLSQNFEVDAIDPANLDPSVLSHPKVAHYQMTAAEFVRENPHKTYDIIVNDMKMDTNESIDIIRDLSGQLNEDGVCILTLKLPKKQVTKRLQIAREVLSKQFHTVRMRQLYYNRSEVTVFLANRKIHPDI